MNATFDATDHCTSAGWATYHGRPRRSKWWFCWLRHRPSAQPVRPDGTHPSCYERCRCGASLKWFVAGQHRFGGLSAPADQPTEVADDGR